MYHTAPRQRARFDLLATRRHVAVLVLLSTDRSTPVMPVMVPLRNSQSER
jgi:hypothetical protein